MFKKILQNFLDKPKRSDFDFGFFCPSYARGWILEKICRELADNLPGKNIIFCESDVIPKCRTYFYPHYHFFSSLFQNNPSIKNAKNIVFFTHEKKEGEIDSYLYYLKSADAVCVMNSSDFDLLYQKGLRNLYVVYCGFDDKSFKPRPRSDKGRTVGMCSAFYPRKNGDLIIQVIKAMPDTTFFLRGKNWEFFNRFSEMICQPNFKYIKSDTTTSNEFFSYLNTFFSASSIEGGPVPLLEAFASNVFPVVSRTGFGPDLIIHGKNGFLFDNGCDEGLVVDLIKESFNINSDVSKTVQNLSWRMFSDNINRINSLISINKSRN